MDQLAPKLSPPHPAPSRLPRGAPPRLTGRADKDTSVRAKDRAVLSGQWGQMRRCERKQSEIFMLKKARAIVNLRFAQTGISGLVALMCFFSCTACDRKSGSKHGELVSPSADVASVRANSNRGSSPADFPELLRLAAQDPALRKSKFKDLIMAGVPADQSEFVFDSILANVGSGQDRNDLLQLFFFHSSSSLKEGLDLIRVQLSLVWRVVSV
jgi:hypothetical protein